jgi:hypothetical protein
LTPLPQIASPPVEESALFDASVTSVVLRVVVGLEPDDDASVAEPLGGASVGLPAQAASALAPKIHAAERRFGRNGGVLHRRGCQSHARASMANAAAGHA